MKYKSVTGYEVFVTNDEVEEYPIELLDNFKCPISLDIIKLPVFLNYNHLFDLDSIVEWFQRSKIHPLTGEELSGDKIEYVPNINLFGLLLLCEQKDDKLIFHKANIEIHDYLSLVSYFFKNFSSIVYHNTKLEDNIFYPCIASHFEEDCEIFLSFSDFMKCPITKKSLYKNTSVTKYGYIINQFSVFGAGYSSWGNISNLCSSFGKKQADSKLFDNLCEYFNLIEETNFILLDLENTKDKNKELIDESKTLGKEIIDIREKRIAHWWYRIFKSQKAIYDFYLSSKSAGKKMLEDYIKLINTNFDSYESFKKQREKAYVEYIKIGYPTLDLNKNVLYIKKINNIPSVRSEESQIYGLDLSGMTIKNFTFTGDMKGYYFAKSKVQNCEFKNCSISIGAFIGTEFINTKFINCTFRESWFVDCIGLQFTGCTVDMLTEARMKDEGII